MKNILLILLITTFAHNFYGQSTFNKVEDYFGTNGKSPNYAQSILHYSNDHYVSLGIFDTLNMFYYCILKLDSHGLENKRFVFKNPNGLISQYPNQTLISTSDSNIMACANLVDSTWAGYLIKFNKDLDTLWTKVYDMPANLCGCPSNKRSINYFTAIKETPDKGFIIAGNYYKNCVNYNQYLRGNLLKVDSLGNIQWWKAYDNVKYLYEIELTPDGGYVFLNKLGPTKFTETDSLGNIEWYIQANSYINWAEAGDISYLGNNQYIVALDYMYNSSYAAMNIYKIDANQQSVLWDTTYFMFHHLKSLSLNQVTGLEVDPQGNLVIWATAHVPISGGRRGAILKLNAQGDSLWAKYYTSPNTTFWDELQLNDLIICDDGSYMGVGYQWFGNSGQVMAWLFKTDANGTIGFKQTVAEPVEASIYPNPAKDYTTIGLSETLTKTAELKVYNSLGQMVLQRTLNQGAKEIKLDLKRFESGVYFFELIGEDGVLGSGKFVRE